jgi:hypothetical protein
MLKLLRTITSRTPAEPKSWLAGQFERKPHDMSDDAIAAWTEFMGRDAAEIWVEARLNQQT